jgi:hypothetical protein
MSVEPGWTTDEARASQARVTRNTDKRLGEDVEEGSRMKPK